MVGCPRFVDWGVYDVTNRRRMGSRFPGTSDIETTRVIERRATRLASLGSPACRVGYRRVNIRRVEVFRSGLAPEHRLTVLVGNIPLDIPWYVSIIRIRPAIDRRLCATGRDRIGLLSEPSRNKRLIDHVDNRKHRPDDVAVRKTPRRIAGLTWNTGGSPKAPDRCCQPRWHRVRICPADPTRRFTGDVFVPGWPGCRAAGTIRRNQPSP